jgi:uncharacterized protein YggL (DUF469 family)
MPKSLKKFINARHIKNGLHISNSEAENIIDLLPAVVIGKTKRVLKSDFNLWLETQPLEGGSYNLRVTNG